MMEEKSQNRQFHRRRRRGQVKFNLKLNQVFILEDNDDRRNIYEINRLHFERRIKNLELILNNVLNSHHRNKIYKERFISVSVGDNEPK